MKIHFKMNWNIDKDELLRKQKEILFLSMAKMEEIARIKAPSDTGLLRRSINLQPVHKEAKEYTISDGVEYGKYVEYGTGPHFPPIKPLKKWAKRVLHDEKASYAIQMKIAKEGTEAQPFFRPALDEVRKIWVEKYTLRVMGKSA